MLRLVNVKRLLVFILAFLVLISGCKTEITTSENKYLITSAPTNSHTPDSLDALMRREAANFEGLSPMLGASDVDGAISVNSIIFDSVIHILLEFFALYQHHSITTHKIVYNDINYKGLTGLVVIPEPKGLEKFPMLALQHPTQVLRKMSPSNYGITRHIDDQLTMPLALFLGRAGYIVVVADYPGLGDSKDVHPYCTKRLGPVVTSMMNAVLEYLDVNNRHIFNGDVYLMGYSEGGYATAVTAQDIEQRYSDRFKLRAVASLDGPHSLSETMRNLMLTADAKYIAPYFLPYVVNGFDDAYGRTVDIVKFDKAIVNPMVTNPTTKQLEPFNPNLRARLDGSYSGTDINNYMKLIQPFVGPKTILAQDFIAELNDNNSKVYALLKENDSTTGWIPKTKFVFFHNSKDDLVPFDNSARAYEDWKAHKNVFLVSFNEFVPGLGSVHAGALIPAIIRGFTWIDKMAYPIRHLNSNVCNNADPLDSEVDMLQKCF